MCVIWCGFGYDCQYGFKLWIYPGFGFDLHNVCWGFACLIIRDVYVDASRFEYLKCRSGYRASSDGAKKWRPHEIDAFVSTGDLPIPDYCIHLENLKASKLEVQQSTML